MKRHLVLAAALVVIAAGVAGWFRPLDLATSAATAGSEPWRLPATEVLQRSTLAEYEAARTARWAGESAAATSATAAWTLLGLVGDLNHRAVLVRVEGDPLIKRIGTGDTLPDGSTLVSVGNDEIVFERNGCRGRRPLYPAGEAQAAVESPPGRCTPAAAH